MDYDQTAIAAKYDAARSYRPEVLRQWLDLIAAHLPTHPTLLVDLGCGTGRFTYPMSDRFQTRVVGIDPSAKMLESARKRLDRNPVEFRQASAEDVPLENGCADLIFMSMVLHHLQDRTRAAQECYRILKVGGRVCVRNSTRETTHPHLHFFPSILSMIETELPSCDEVLAMFENVGLRVITLQRVSQLLAIGWDELADKLAWRADSFLARLCDAEFTAGMTALRAHARASGSHEPIVEDIQFFAFGN